MKLRIGSLFTGTGGLDMAAQAAVGGGEVVWHSDIKPAAVTLLEHHYPGVPNLGDLTAVDFRDVDPVDVITFGWPCQPHSSAGKRLGEADPRALWPHVIRAVQELRPRILLGENVARVATNGELRRVVHTLAALGYVGTWRCLTAAGIGAPHKRDRIALVAVRGDAAADPLGVELRDEPGRCGGSGGAGARVAGHDGPAWPTGLTLLPTPTQSMTTGAGTSGRDGGLNLQTAVALLPTPTARDASRGAGWGDQPGRPLGETILRVTGARWGVYAAAIDRWERLFGPAPDPTMISPRSGTPQLAPAFVEWMMGVPAGHVTGVPGLTRNQQLSLLGDGVVPPQLAAGFEMGLSRIVEQVAA